MKSVEEILIEIRETGQLLNQMFKEGVHFSFHEEIIYHNHNIINEIDALIQECTDFFHGYSKPKGKKRIPKHYDPIFWWYRFGIAKYCYINNVQIRKEDYNMMSKFRSGMRAKYYHRQRKRNKAGQIDYYYFTEEEIFKIRLLEAIEMLWNREDETWELYYSLLCRYYDEFEHTYVPTHKSYDGLDLGAWVTKIINNRDVLTPTQIKQLEAVKFPYKHLVISGTSFWEQALYYYIKQWYSDAKNRKKKKGYELDIYIPGPPKIAIEYDGYYSHRKEEKYQRDRDKDQFCIDNGIEIIRVREYGLKATEKAKNFFLYKRDFSFKDFDRVAKEVLKYVCHTEMLPIDTTEFMDNIIKQYCHLESLPQYKNVKKLTDYYEQHLEWPTKSSNLELWRLMCGFRNAKEGKYMGLINRSWLDELEEKNFPFNPYNEKFEKFMAHIQRYYETEGDINMMEIGYVDYYDGKPYNLYSQLQHIKWRHPDNIKGYGTKKGRVLTPEQVERLNKLDLDWSINKNKGEKQIISDEKRRKIIDFIADKEISDTKTISKTFELKASITRNFLKQLVYEGILEIEGGLSYKYRKYKFKK